jgi:putative glutathione S-transferase
MTNKIVNNESSEIIRILNTAFGLSDLDLYPEHLRASIDETNAWIYAQLNNGVYRCGFAQSQAAYDSSITDVLGALGRIEGILSTQRYLCSDDQITEADVRLYPTLVRYDEVYIVYFKVEMINTI